MNVNLKRLACIFAVAVLAMSVARPTAAKKPQPEPPPDFTIETSEWNYSFVPEYPIWDGQYWYSGEWHPDRVWTEDVGESIGKPIYEKDRQVGETLWLTSWLKDGSAEVLIAQRFKKKDSKRQWSGTFLIVKATGEYAFLLGATGSATGAVDQFYSYRTVTLKGFFP
jgi:hypothetical protein